jgi:predicted RNA-binding protein YlxR (DUF448 family)
MKTVERICCVCRAKQPADKMIRVARIKNADNSSGFAADKTHKLGGRGCYVCSQCVQKAVKTKALNRSFKCPVPENVYNELLPLARNEAGKE